MKYCAAYLMAVAWLACLSGFAPTALTAPAESTRILIGSWKGKASGPGGPPTGDIAVTFEKDPVTGIKGTILVRSEGGIQYRGQVYDVTLKNKLFSATAVFKLGEILLEVKVTGPLKGRTIDGSFSVMSKGQKMGEGTFSITKGAVANASPKP